MIKETKSYRVLHGMRGERPKDITSLAELLVHVSQLYIITPSCYT